MKPNRRPVTALLPPVVVIAVVVFLYFFYSDTHDYSPLPYQSLPAPQQADHKDSRSRMAPVKKPLPGRPQLHRHSDVTPASSVTSERRHVILVTQARSGSSFTGDVINHSPDVYYVFEPLIRLEKILSEQYNSNESPEAKESIRNRFQDMSKDILDRFLSCDFHGLDLTLLKSEFLRRSAKSGSLGRCVTALNKQLKASSSSSSSSSVASEAEAAAEAALNASLEQRSCLITAQKVCGRSRSRAIKVIRIPLRDIVPLLDDHQDLALVLLVRDPRASLWSRVKVFNTTNRQGYRALSRRVCRQMDDDVDAVTELQPRYPNRVKILRYETLAERPIALSQLLYHYLGLTWAPWIERRIRAQTSFEERALGLNSLGVNVRQKMRLDSPYSIVKEDSANASQAWRAAVPWSFVEQAQQECSHVLRRLGYARFRLEQDLRDTELPFFHHRHVKVPKDVWLQ
ncbi:carbohydrate sulfotransferase 1-like isoform X2 [Babylonia areolata]